MESADDVSLLSEGILYKMPLLRKGLRYTLAACKINFEDNLQPLSNFRDVSLRVGKEMNTISPYTFSLYIYLQESIDT
jgi:hypothetical protein